MKGFPKTIATKADLLNCLAMAQATPPAFPVSELAAAIEQIEAGAYLHCPILGVDGTTVTIGYCAEAAAGQTTGNGAKITAVEHIEEDDATGTKQLTNCGDVCKGAAVRYRNPADSGTQHRRTAHGADRCRTEKY